MPESQVIESSDVPRGTILEGAYVKAYEDEETPIRVEDAAAQLGIPLANFLGYCMDRRHWMPRSDGQWVYPSSLQGLREYLAHRAPFHSSGGAS
jgi:hypothetical protein